MPHEEEYKLPFDIHRAMELIQAAVAPYPKAALFQLADEGYDSAFEVLVACIISIRTRDEVTIPTARRLFTHGRTPAKISRLSPAAIAEAIKTSSFYEAKALQIHEIARRVTESSDGLLPCEAERMLSFRGVGPKCTHLVLGIACNQPRIAVDIHVHRVTNRWGYVHESAPERTMLALEARLPVEYHIEINRLLVPFGKHICTGSLPHCSTCPVLNMCQQVGVTRHR